MFCSVIVSDQAGNPIGGSLWTRPLGIKGLLRAAGSAFGQDEGLVLKFQSADPDVDVSDDVLDTRNLVVGEGPQRVVYTVMGGDTPIGDVEIEVHDKLPIDVLPLTKTGTAYA